VEEPGGEPGAGQWSAATVLQDRLLEQQPSIAADPFGVDLWERYTVRWAGWVVAVGRCRRELPVEGAPLPWSPGPPAPAWVPPTDSAPATSPPPPFCCAPDSPPAPPPHKNKHSWEPPEGAPAAALGPSSDDRAAAEEGGGGGGGEVGGASPWELWPLGTALEEAAAEAPGLSRWARAAACELAAAGAVARR
jgi:hypothetical protein